jgi:hypothetical protein
VTAEDRDCCAFVVQFRARWPIYAGRLVHVANEAGIRGAHPGYHVKRKRMGVREGVADYLLAIPRRDGSGGLWLELKAAGGRVSDEQRAFLRDMADDYACAVAWGWQSAAKAVGDYLRGEGFPDDDAAAYICERRVEWDAITQTGTPRKRPAKERV